MVVQTIFNILVCIAVALIWLTFAGRFDQQLMLQIQNGLFYILLDTTPQSFFPSIA